MKKFVAMFAVECEREYLRLFAETKEEAEKIAISTYEDYKRDGFIKDYVFVYIREMEAEKK